MNGTSFFTKTLLATCIASATFSAADAATTKLTGLSATTIKPTLLTPTKIGAANFSEKSVRVVNGKQYTFIKEFNEEGDTKTIILDAKGNHLKAVPAGKVERISPDIYEWLKQAEGTGDYESLLSVNIALDLPTPTIASQIEMGEVEILDGQTISGIINGKRLKGSDVEEYADKLADGQTKQIMEQAQAQQSILQKWAKSHGLLDSKGMKEAIGQAASGITLQLNATTLRRLVESKDETIAGIEITPKERDTINAAMADTNILNWALPFAATRGDDIGIYMTESGCAQESRFANYDRLSGSETNHSRNVGGIIKAASPDSFLYCRGSAVLPQVSDLDGVGGNPPIYVVNRSNGGNYSTNYNTTDRSWDNFAYDYNLAMHVSAGNEGNNDGFVISPAKGLNITTVGNYNDANNTINSGSSFVDPQTGNQKPEVSAPGTSITAGGFTMTGTSMSSPHAAAFTADMMSRSTYLKYRPYLAKAKLIAGATDPIAGGYNAVGEGGIDFLSAQWSGYWSWWSGGNNSWNYFDNLDGNNDGYVTRRVYISSGWDNVRVALAWMNRGTYTYNHRNDAHPIGQDLDLRVYDPNGNWVGSSASWDDPFEVVDFTPNVSGYYTFKIKRYANRDTSSAVRMGLYVNYYN